MATYIIGDVQGCFDSFQNLLDVIQFDARDDRICFLGDLVNRGPGSLSMLRWAKAHGAVNVLGNHDLYCLARYAGGQIGHGDTLAELLDAPDVDDLMEWLRHCPFVWVDERAILVHAGFKPQWSLSEAISIAEAATETLTDANWKMACRQMVKSGVGPTDVSILTRIRMCRITGDPDFKYKGKPQDAPAHLVPWFEKSLIGSQSRPVFFGHWAALGHIDLGRVVSLDTGCVWGRTLSACRLDDRRVFDVPAVPTDIYTDL